MSHPAAQELSRSNLFASLTREDLERATELFTIRSYPKDAILVSESDRLEFFSILLAGRVTFFWRDETGRQVDVAIVSPPEDFAAQALTGEPMLNSVIALGKQETLRVNGSAFIVRDAWIRQRMAIKDKLPDFAIVVKVEEVFFHCAKCMLRSKLWEPAAWPDTKGLPSLAEASIAHARLNQPLHQVQALIDKGLRERLY